MVSTASTMSIVLRCVNSSTVRFDIFERGNTDDDDDTVSTILWAVHTCWSPGRIKYCSMSGSGRCRIRCPQNPVGQRRCLPGTRGAPQSPGRQAQVRARLLGLYHRPRHPDGCEPFRRNPVNIQYTTIVDAYQTATTFHETSGTALTS